MICTQPDDYTADYGMWNAVWNVTLNDGTQVWDDDKRPGTTLPSWLRLKAHCEENQLYITNMYLKFRSHFEHLPERQDGYFLIRKVLSYIGSRNIDYFITGSLIDGNIHSQTWRIPELILEEEKIRDCDTDEEFLIKCPQMQTNLPT